MYTYVWLWLAVKIKIDSEIADDNIWYVLSIYEVPRYMLRTVAVPIAVYTVVAASAGRRRRNWRN